MALTILAHEGSTFAGAKRGAAVELGININRFTVRYYTEVNDTVLGQAGQTLWRIMSDTFSREITCDGEILGPHGVMLFTVASALTFANGTTTFTPTSGTIFMDEATVTASRGGWFAVSIKASARATL